MSGDQSKRDFFRDVVCKEVGGELTAEGYIHTALGTWELLLANGEPMMRPVDAAAHHSTDAYQARAE